MFYEEWFKRMPEIRHDPDEPVVLHMTLTMGLEKLPIVWTV